MPFDINFYNGKKVFVTGHTGFKGSWLCKILINAGAIVTGYSLTPPTNPNLFGLCGIESKMTSIIGDIRDYDSLKKAFDNAEPEIVLHLAAQPIVRESIAVQSLASMCDLSSASSSSMIPYVSYGLRDSVGMPFLRS